MVEVRGVIDDFMSLPQAPTVIDGLDDRERCSCDALGSFHHPLQCLPVRDCTVSIPDRDTVREDALNGAAVEVPQSLRR